MEKDDTAFRYFQNIASWSARPEVHLRYDQTDARDWWPDCIDYKIDIDKKWTKFSPKISSQPKIDLSKLSTLFAFDNSTSINRRKQLYFNEIERIVKKYYKEGDKFFLWGSSYKEQTKSQIDDWIKERKGKEGTNTENIAKLAHNCPNQREHLIIVTDGEVNESFIKGSDRLMEQYNIQFKFVSVYIIGDEGNLSVGAPFCRGCPNRSIQILDENKRNSGPTLSLDEISALNNINGINSFNQFDNTYDKLLSAIKARQLGRNADNELCEKLKLLNDRIINSLNEEQKNNFEVKWKKLYDIASLGIHDFDIGTAGIKKK